jgi:hypothetical protein
VSGDVNKPRHIISSIAASYRKIHEKDNIPIYVSISPAVVALATSPAVLALAMLIADPGISHSFK